MGAPKLYSNLYVEKDKDSNLRDKQIIEALLKRLNDRILNNHEDAKKAALILENWLKKK